MSFDGTYNCGFSTTPNNKGSAVGTKVILYGGVAAVSAAYFSYKIFRSSYKHTAGPLLSSVNSLGSVGGGIVMGLCWPVTLTGSAIWQVTDWVKQHQRTSVEEAACLLQRQQNGRMGSQRDTELHNL
jgi:hypothetical protein